MLINCGMVGVSGGGVGGAKGGPGWEQTDTAVLGGPSSHVSSRSAASVSSVVMVF